MKTISPIRPHDPYLFARYAEQFEQYVSLATRDVDLLRTVHDRMQLAAAAAEASVAVPDTRLLTEVDDWTPELIIKSRYNLLTGDYLTEYNATESETVKTVTHLDPGDHPDKDAVIEEMNHVPIVQKYIRSVDEYVFGALYDHGEPLATFQHRQIRDDSYTGVSTVRRSRFPNSKRRAVPSSIVSTTMGWLALST